ncbi:DUF808 domain-containing protein [Snodgrassella sp. CFCC 13594]|uniref:DUF808 domain-containing protein n=1 Tax=Snodgrassella sp. CFCC 13594 TaxID=1775559 RepID=UPI00082D555C|nr:DUF808 domain-containing protein [Snodgrassella sp. CFCC 13594]
MAFASLLTLLDDITAVLDDVALMTKMAAKKTAGVVGDDLALNANQVTGVQADRELAVIWAVAKGSLINKIILIPLALLISYFIPALITPLLMVGGAYLCFEGVEKLWHKIRSGEHAADQHQAAEDISTPADEQAKIRGAVRTDFILSAEIIIIALGVVADMAMWPKAVVMTLIGVGMTVLVYGVVACIVKMDDAGLWLGRQSSALARALGKGLIVTVPWLMRLLAVAGMLAMFLVGGGIMVHGLAFVHDFLHAQHWDSGLMNMLANLVVGIITGMVVCAVVLPLMAWRQRRAKAH